METTDARTGLSWLDREQCLAFLADEEVGRLAFVVAGAPVVVPVNYGLDGDTVVFRTGPGAKLDDGPGRPVSFEIDSFDRGRRTGWSVVVTGRLEEVTPFDSATYERVHRLGVEPWAEGDRSHWLRLIPTRITGRRIGAPGREG